MRDCCNPHLRAPEGFAVFMLAVGLVFLGAVLHGAVWTDKQAEARRTTRTVAWSSLDRERNLRYRVKAQRDSARARLRACRQTLEVYEVTR